MKKISLIIMTASMLCWGCTKVIKDEGSDIDTTGYTVLTAQIEDLELPGYDPSVALWSKDDKVVLFSNNHTEGVCWRVRMSSDGTDKAVFYGPLVTGQRIIGVFPYNHSLEYDGTSIICEVPGVQKYVSSNSATEHFLNYNPYVYGLVEDGEIDFKYACGLLEIDFDLAFPTAISSLIISSQSQFLSGRMSYNGETLTGTGASSNTILLDFDGNSYMSDVLTVYVVIRPATYNDLVISISMADGEKMSLDIPPTTIRRITSEHYTSGHITISSSDLPALDQEEGYWEEDK